MSHSIVFPSLNRSQVQLGILGGAISGMAWRIAGLVRMPLPWLAPAAIGIGSYHSLIKADSPLHYKAELVGFLFGATIGSSCFTNPLTIALSAAGSGFVFAKILHETAL